MGLTQPSVCEFRAQKQSAPIGCRNHTRSRFQCAAPCVAGRGVCNESPATAAKAKRSRTDSEREEGAFLHRLTGSQTSRVQGFTLEFVQGFPTKLIFNTPGARDL